MEKYIHGNAVICVTRPELTAEDQKKQEGRILTVLQQFGKAMQDAERRIEENVCT